jgi:hypothetical protein
MQVVDVKGSGLKFNAHGNVQSLTASASSLQLEELRLGNCINQISRDPGWWLQLSEGPRSIKQG